MRMPDDDGEHREGGGFCGGGDQDDDPGWVEQVGHGQGEDSHFHRVAFFGLVTAAVPVLLPEHHGDRDDEKDDAAGDAESARGEVQQPGQQAAEDQQQHGNDGGGGQHLAHDAAAWRPPACPWWLRGRGPARSSGRRRSGAAGTCR